MRVAGTLASSAILGNIRPTLSCNNSRCAAHQASLSTPVNRSFLNRTRHRLYFVGWAAGERAGQRAGQIGNGYLLYYFPGSGITFLRPPAGLQGTQLRELVGILPHPLTLMIMLVLICHFLLSRTRFGQHTYAIGGNAEVSSRGDSG